jgi:hypothetical protein
VAVAVRWRYSEFSNEYTDILHINNGTVSANCRQTKAINAIMYMTKDVAVPTKNQTYTQN